MVRIKRTAAVAGAVAVLIAGGAGVASATQASSSPQGATPLTLDCNQPQPDTRVEVRYGPDGGCYVAFQHLGHAFPGVHEGSPATLVSDALKDRVSYSRWECGEESGCSPVAGLADRLTAGDYPVKIISAGEELDLNIRIHA
ncbi:hypothetical protein NCG97_07245 [Streptomyces lydicamycinicus]|uniref:Putative glycosidase n=1 Tax=Streptomyces lydicamycinicus TaxID=1546107 RepID=A0A0P4RHX3_9ACTN|nr:hypothetical protein [Streptomyces lydicamycinicus]USA00518.1 hypothetical protein NCG97_07245 [Streptomyces lydicamycinicus]GAO13015.1 putative glycosidase [Streptomyces lydicamycinicus]